MEREGGMKRAAEEEPVGDGERAKRACPVGTTQGRPAAAARTPTTTAPAEVYAAMMGQHLKIVTLLTVLFAEAPRLAFDREFQRKVTIPMLHFISVGEHLSKDMMGLLRWPANMEWRRPLVGMLLDMEPLLLRALKELQPSCVSTMPGSVSDTFVLAFNRDLCGMVEQWYLFENGAVVSEKVKKRQDSLFNAIHGKAQHNAALLNPKVAETRVVAAGPGGVATASAPAPAPAPAKAPAPAMAPAPRPLALPPGTLRPLELPPAPQPVARPPQQEHGTASKCPHQPK